MHGDAFGSQSLGEGRFGFVVAAYVVAIGLEPARQGRHADAAYPQKENVRKLLQFNY